MVACYVGLLELPGTLGTVDQLPAALSLATFLKEHNQIPNSLDPNDRSC